MAIYMKYGSIAGPVTTEGFKDWIECNSFQWGVGRSLGTGMREFKNSVTGKDDEPAQLPPAQQTPPVPAPPVHETTPAPPADQP